MRARPGQRPNPRGGLGEAGDGPGFGPGPLRPRGGGRAAWVMAAWGAMAGVAACTPTPPPDLTVFAAADLRDAFGEIVPLFEARTGLEVVLVLGSTGNLAAQVEHGAPADLFFSARDDFVDRLEAAGRVEPGSRAAYAVGRVALVWRNGVEPPTDLEALVQPMYEVIAIANPEHAPYGHAAREALRSAGVWEAVQPRVVLGENAVQAWQFVETGHADAGLVAMGQVMGRPGWPHLLLPDTLHPPLVQVAAVIRGSPRAQEARAFLELVLSEEGQAILQRYGFDPPPG